MPWNNGYERKKFEEEQKKLAEEYRAAGMSEEQIHQMYLFDLAQFNSLRCEREHTQSFPDGFPKDDPEGTSPLNQKFLSAVSTETQMCDFQSHDWWIDDLDSPELIALVHKLTPDELELITLIVYEKVTQKEAAERLGIVQGTVSKNYEKVKKFLRNFRKTE